jgi:hypothetical protein
MPHHPSPPSERLAEAEATATSAVTRVFDALREAGWGLNSREGMPHPAR